ncbi:MAG: hypothetical protein CMN25_04200 [Salinicola sp.]|uniref:DUF2501 domain-containing protein n=1 Tax=Salinicola sp. TaxID=1978524 RepID=UPI000C8CA365|nr:DUF2501 domain-containing protein [Salinicola sp.]MAM56517.1 hypothetical protein [Salinicola sp.]NRB55159.1 DUF2501 domain-containing protein [Salinicola sp.]
MNLRFLSAALLTASIAASPLASAFSFDSAKKNAGEMMSGQSSQGGGAASSASLLSSLGSGSMNLGSMQNVAGVLGYCQQQGYTESTTDKVKNSLLEKVGGQSQAKEDPGYQQGLSGLLQGGNGQTFSLANLKDQAGKKACGMITDKAMSSFLGG